MTSVGDKGVKHMGQGILPFAFSFLNNLMRFARAVSTPRNAQSNFTGFIVIAFSH